MGFRAGRGAASPRREMGVGGRWGAVGAAHGSEPAGDPGTVNRSTGMSEGGVWQTCACVHRRNATVRKRVRVP